MKIFIKYLKVVISFFLYILVFFTFIYIIDLILGFEVLLQQFEYADKCKELLVHMFFFGGIWGFASPFYNLIFKKINILFNYFGKKFLQLKGA